MYYTTEQIQMLAPYAGEFRRAIESNYARPPHSADLARIREAYMAAAGIRVYPRDFGCTYCVITLLKDAGRLYFADMEERAAQQSVATPEEAQESTSKLNAGNPPTKTAKTAKTAPKSSKTAKTTKK